jgi:predicted XRE-type DNA-binding protein
MVTKNTNIGSSLDDFLTEEGIREQVEAVAIKRVITYQIEQTMKKKHLTKTMMAKRMHTSRSAIERLFDPENESVTLTTLSKAAHALGKKLQIKLV